MDGNIPESDSISFLSKIFDILRYLSELCQVNYHDEPKIFDSLVVLDMGIIDHAVHD